MPNIDQSTLHRQASVDIDVLHLEEEVDTITVLVLLDVLTDHFTPDVVGAIGDGGSQNGAGVGAEDVGLGGLGGVVKETGLVVVDGFPLLEGSQVTAELVGSYL